MHTYKVGRDFALSVQSCHTFPRWTTFTKLVLDLQNYLSLVIIFHFYPMLQSLFSLDENAYLYFCMHSCSVNMYHFDILIFFKYFKVFKIFLKKWKWLFFFNIFVLIIFLLEISNIKKCLYLIGDFFFSLFFLIHAYNLELKGVGWITIMSQL